MQNRMLILSKGQWLRQTYVFVLYFSQGLPIALWTILIPHNLRTMEYGFIPIGLYMTAVMAPWVFGRILTGPLVDRYSRSIMGRRRHWIVIGQSTSLVSFLLLSALGPHGTDLSLIVLFAVIINFGIAIQDTATDALAVDITPPRLRGATTSFMFSGQVVGLSVGSAFGALYWEANREISYLLLVIALVFFVALLFTLAVKETSDKISCKSKINGVSSVATRQTFKRIIHDTATTLSETHIIIFALGCIALGVTLSAWNLAAPTYAADLEWSKSKLGLVRAIGSLLGAFVALVITSKLIDRVGTVPIIATLLVTLTTMDLTLALSLPIDLEIILVAKDISTQSLFIALAVVIMRICSTSSTASIFGIVFSLPTMTLVISTLPIAMLLASSGYQYLWQLMVFTGTISVVLLGVSSKLISNASPTE